jgi:hypothetical protein
MSTYTEKAQSIVSRQLHVAALDGGIATNRSLRFDANGGISHKGQPVEQAEAVQILAEQLEREANPDALPTRSFSWYRLNEGTKDFFFWLCRQIEIQSKDPTLRSAVPIGRDHIHLTTAQCPLLTNLKKAGVIESHQGAGTRLRSIQLTTAGHDIWNNANRCCPSSTKQT